MTVPATARLVEDAERSTLTSRSAAIGAIRAARRAGNQADSTVMPTPTANDRIIACALITIGPLGISYPNAAISIRRPDATPTPATRPATDASTPTTSASISTERLTCRPEAPIARSIAMSRVRWATVIENVLLMMKAPTKTATNANTSMITVNGLMSAATAAWSCSIERGAGDDLDAVSDRGLHGGCDIGLRHTRIGGDGDRVRLARGGEQLGGGGVGEQHRGRTRRRVLAGEGGDAGDRELPRLALREHGRYVAQLVAGLVGARLVDHDLVVGRRSVPAGELVGIEVGDVDPVAAERRVLAHVADGLAVAPDELGVPVDAQRGLVDAVGRSDGVEQRGVEPGAGLAVAEVDLRGSPDVGVDSLVGLGQHGVEGGTDRVGEDDGAGHEGDTEEHREGGGQEAQLASCQLLERESEHRDQPPRVRMRSRTESAVGASRSSTIRPSARNTARSAYEAATGSWVTMTIVWPNSRTAVRMNERISAPVRESRLPVGSSAKMISGRLARARATATRCCCPPESSDGRCLRRFVETDGLDDVVEPRRVGRAAGESGREGDVLGRRERRHEVERLEDEADPIAAQLGELLVVELGDVGVADQHGARREVVEPGDAVHQRRLARARRAHDGGEAAGRELDGHAVEGADLALAAPVDLDGVEDSGGGRRSRGLGASKPQPSGRGAGDWMVVEGMVWVSWWEVIGDAPTIRETGAGIVGLQAVRASPSAYVWRMMRAVAPGWMRRTR